MSDIFKQILLEEFPQISDIRIRDGYDLGIDEIAPYEYNTKGNKHSFAVYWKIKETGKYIGYLVSPKLVRRSVDRGWPLGRETYTEYDYSLDHVLSQVRKAIEHSLVSDENVQIAPRYTYEEC